MKRRIVISFTAGLLATSGCGGKDAPPAASTPPASEVETEPGTEGTDPAVAELPEAVPIPPGQAEPLIYTNPPPQDRLPKVGTGPDGRPLVPVPVPEIMPVRSRPLPTWDESKSRHPEGATNPPSPVLIVGEVDGACFKRWVSPMIRDRESMTPHVEKCTVNTDSPDGNTCGSPVQCPPEAAELLAAHEAAQGEP